MKIQSKCIHFHSRKSILKMSSGKWRPFCLGLNVLRPPWKEVFLRRFHPTRISIRIHPFKVYKRMVPNLNEKNRRKINQCIRCGCSHGACIDMPWDSVWTCIDKQASGHQQPPWWLYFDYTVTRIISHNTDITSKPQHLRNYIYQHRPITAFWLVFITFYTKKICLNIGH